MSRKQFIRDLTTELNNKCTRLTNYHLNEVGSSWTSNNFDFYHAELYCKSKGCSNNQNYECYQCSEVLKRANKKFKQISFNDNIDSLLEKVESLQEDINQLKEDISVIRLLLESKQ